MSDKFLIPVERIERTILRLRGHNVMLDADLAAMYGVKTGELVRAVGRNLGRFPADFMFRLTRLEFEDLRSQFGTSSSWGGRRHLPYAFTEQGVAMLSSVLRSPRAVKVNIEIMRAFVRLRRMLQSNAELAKKLDELEAKYDAQFKVVFHAIRELMMLSAAAEAKAGRSLGSVGEWRICTVDQIKADDARAIAIGPFGSRMKADTYVPQGVPVIRGNNISDTRAIVGDLVFVSDATADQLRSCNVFADDLVFPHRGAIGEVGIVPNDGVRRYILSTSLMKLTCNRNLVDPLFIYYFFRSH